MSRPILSGILRIRDIQKVKNKAYLLHFLLMIAYLFIYIRYTQVISKFPLYLQLVNHFLQVVGSNFLGHNFNHFFPDQFDLRVLSIRCFLILVSSSLGKTNAEQSQEIPICSFDINITLN